MSMHCERIVELEARERFAARVGILIPAHDEAEHLEALLAACRRVGPARVLVVDDGSTDDTPALLDRLRRCFAAERPLEVIRSERTLGKQGAVRLGLRALADRGLDAVALIDGDGQHDPAELPALAALLERYDMVIGARRRDRMPLQRRLSNLLVNLGFAWIGGLDFGDVQSGLRLYRGWLVAVLADRLPPAGGYALEHESLTLLARYARDNARPIRAAAAPVGCSYGPGTSSMKAHHIVGLGLQTLRQALRLRRARQALPLDRPVRAGWAGSAHGRQV
jgi:glycosyltransferase involved in cell wall biosynthesis